MAVKEMIVCDVCGSPAAAPITLSITINGKRTNFTKDLCKKDLDAYMAKARPTRPGRPSGQYSGVESSAQPQPRKLERKASKEAGQEEELPELHPEGTLVAEVN